jgi:DNA polymerase III alpha subunit
MSTNTLENLITGILNHGPNVLKYSVTDCDLSKYIKKIEEENLDYPVPPLSVNSADWFIPQEYKDMDIEEFLINQCPKENYNRLIEELELYRNNQMIPVLKTMKYIIDTLRKHNIVWGVGRGSSVASYALFLIGVHKVDSVKYNLPIEEFFKEKQNG